MCSIACKIMLPVLLVGLFASAFSIHTVKSETATKAVSKGYPIHQIGNSLVVADVASARMGRNYGETTVSYQIAIYFETERYRESVEYDPQQVRFKLAIVSYSNSTDIAPCKQLFPGTIGVTFEITMQNGSVTELHSSYEYSGDGSWIMMWSPFVSMSDDLWIIRIGAITSNPAASFTAIDNVHLMRRRSLLLAVQSDYYNRFSQDMPHLFDVVSEAYEHMVSITEVRAPLVVVLSTLYRCTVADETACYISIYGERTNYSFFSNYMRLDACILTVFHEMAHSMMNLNDYVFNTQGLGGYRNWFNEGEAEYIASIELPRYFGSRGDEFIDPQVRDRSIKWARDTFDILLKNNGTITNTAWRTTPDAGMALQEGSHPELEGAALLDYLARSFRLDLFDYLYRHIDQLWESFPSTYHVWTDVWTAQVDGHARDTVLVGLLSKAACTNLTSLFSGNLSFQLYDMNSLQSHLNSDVFDSYASLIGTKQTVLSLALKPQAVTSGENVTITALLTNSSKEPVPSQEVDFYIDSSFIGSSSTNSSGVATMIYQASIGLGAHNITAYCSGEAGYTESLGRTALTIQVNPDLNRDGKVNILDISIVAKAFASKPGDPKWNAAADLNGDRIVNILDISLVARSFGKKA